MAVLFAVIATASGCGRASSNKQPIPAQSAQQADPRPVGVTGIPIDPAKKEVVVVNAPTQAASPQQMVAQMHQQHEKTEAQLNKLMKDYAGNIHNAKTKDKLAQEMSGQLEVYKRQSLELYKVQRAQGQTASTAP